MNKIKIISSVLGTLGVLMISMGLVVQSRNTVTTSNSLIVDSIDIKDMAASSNMIIKNTNNTSTALNSNSIATNLVAVNMEVAPASLTRIEVYDGLTKEELVAKLNKNLGSGYMAGKGDVLATRCLALGVDPYLALAIILHETGCQYGCSSLVRNCNNVGGQKGSPACSGSYKGYASLDEGINGFVDNLYYNYYAYGLNTVASIAPRYAEGSEWASNINNYIAKIRAS
jgi:hypothetical protein